MELRYYYNRFITGCCLSLSTHGYVPPGRLLDNSQPLGLDSRLVNSILLALIFHKLRDQSKISRRIC